MNQIKAVMIDSREPAAIRNLRFGGVPVSTVNLDHGDLCVATSDGAILVVERKTPGDLLNSIADGRLFTQVVGMRTVSPWVYLVIEGEYGKGANDRVVTGDRVTGWDYYSLQGALQTVQELGCVVYHCPAGAVEQAVTRIAARSRGPLKITPPRHFRVLSEGEMVIADLPGIGPEKLDVILDQCQTPAWSLVVLSNDEIPATIPGVGTVTVKKIRKALGLRDDQELMVLMKESASGNERVAIPGE